MGKRRISRDFDVIVIGSGAGGLAAAVALANAGKRVAVFEQHYLPGGWCHSFSLSGYRFSPGVHYIGELGPGRMMRRVYEGLGLGADLAFYELNPAGFDHVLVGDQRFDIPAGREAFGARMKARFPREARGIDAYLGTIASLGAELGDVFTMSGLKDFVQLPWRAPTLARWGLRSARALIDGHVQDPMLRAVLAAQCGDHGLPPSLAPAPLHAAVTNHYIDGGFYPRGGASSIPRAFIRALQRKGGDIFVETGVDRVLLEGRRAIGVRLMDGTTITARTVVSNADPDVTFRKLVGEEHLGRSLKRKLASTRYSLSALSLFLAVDMDLRRAGLDSGNYWHFAHDDLEQIFQHGRSGWGHEVRELPALFFTATTLKDPSKRYGGHHTLEAFSFVGHDAFRQWASTAFGDRPGSYEALKVELTARMMRTLARRIPGIEEHVVFSELGTPLTNVHYCAATGGNLYGTEKTLGQLGPRGYGVRTEIEDLWLAGASTLGHGVLPATISGLVAAQGILGCSLDDLLQQRGGSITLLAAEPAPMRVTEAAA
jgi:all-trans-retinol 13,14-reductase